MPGTLGRDTAVRGDRAEEAAAISRRPGGADSALPTARSAPARHKNKTP